MFGVPCTNHHLAEILLRQADIPPFPESNWQPDDQYEISSFEYTVLGIRIVNRGQEHFLKVVQSTKEEVDLGELSRKMTYAV